MAEEIWELRKCERCDWMFVISREDAALCNQCGKSSLHPRVCLMGGKETSRETLLKLVPYMLSYVSGSSNRTAKQIVERDIDEVLDPG